MLGRMAINNMCLESFSSPLIWFVAGMKSESIGSLQRHRYRAEISIPTLDALHFDIALYHEAENTTFDFALDIAFTLNLLILVNMATNKSLLLSAIPASKNPTASSYKGVAFH